MTRRAVSPVIATVVLVAVAITIAVAVSYWMGEISRGAAASTTLEQPKAKQLAGIYKPGAYIGSWTARGYSHFAYYSGDAFITVVVGSGYGNASYEVHLNMGRIMLDEEYAAMININRELVLS